MNDWYSFRVSILLGSFSIYISELLDVIKCFLMVDVIVLVFHSVILIGWV